jgi:hypothetical protein
LDFFPPKTSEESPVNTEKGSFRILSNLEKRYSGNYGPDMFVDCCWRGTNWRMYQATVEEDVSV